MLLRKCSQDSASCKSQALYLSTPYAKLLFLLCQVYMTYLLPPSCTAMLAVTRWIKPALPAGICQNENNCFPYPWLSALAA